MDQAVFLRNRRQIHCDFLAFLFLIVFELHEVDGVVV